jgi:AcrR family transcriptional regulator
VRESAKTLFAERGFEDATTAAVCRLAGTSQSQLIKHFTDKQGVLEAIFEHAWEQINPAVRLATENIASPREKLRVLIDMVLGFLEKDRAMRTLFLLEGRRILKELAAQGELAPSIHPQAFRSALMGAIEGMLRDHMLARTSRFPASYAEADMRAMISSLLSFVMTK